MVVVFYVISVTLPFANTFIHVRLTFKQNLNSKFDKLFHTTDFTVVETFTKTGPLEGLKIWGKGGL